MGLLPAAISEERAVPSFPPPEPGINLAPSGQEPLSFRPRDNLSAGSWVSGQFRMSVHQTTARHIIALPGLESTATPAYQVRICARLVSIWTSLEAAVTLPATAARGASGFPDQRLRFQTFLSLSAIPWRLLYAPPALAPRKRLFSMPT